MLFLRAIQLPILPIRSEIPPFSAADAVYYFAGFTRRPTLGAFIPLKHASTCSPMLLLFRYILSLLTCARARRAGKGAWRGARKREAPRDVTMPRRQRAARSDGRYVIIRLNRMKSLARDAVNDLVAQSGASTRGRCTMLITAYSRCGKNAARSDAAAI